MPTVARLLSMALLADSATAMLSTPRTVEAGEVCLGKPGTVSGSGAIEGTTGDDVILGSAGRDVILGLGGDGGDVGDLL